MANLVSFIVSEPPSLITESASERVKTPPLTVTSPLMPLKQPLTDWPLADRDAPLATVTLLIV